VKSRAEREAIVMEQLDELRVKAPEVFAEMLELLARMVAEAEQRKAVH